MTDDGEAHRRRAYGALRVDRGAVGGRRPVEGVDDPVGPQRLADVGGRRPAAATAAMNSPSGLPPSGSGGLDGRQQLAALENLLAARR